MGSVRARACIVIALLAVPGPAVAGDLSKEACIDAHSRGQDVRDQGKLSLARKLFLSCAQAACPAAVQSDCARLADDLAAMQPSIVFVARDEAGNDLPETSVQLDGRLVQSRLDGRPHDVDPGNHTVRFSHRGRDYVVSIMIGAGEKSRTVLGRFRSQFAASPPPATALAPAPTPRLRTTTTRPAAAMPLVITGSLVALAGGAVAFYGTTQIPSECSLSSRQCAAPPGDPAFAHAARGARTVNAGLVAGGVGAAMLAGGLLWYVAGARTTTERSTQVAPLLGRDAAGVALSRRF
jgi:hypothetical protein